jgi:Protein of unknown function DUF262
MPRQDWSAMKYVNREMKIDQIIAYFNDKKINLLPPFQRGSVWKIHHRRKLIENMVKERPIPAIFLYKQESGSQFSYNILDGKQRLESLILFVGNKRADMNVQNVEHHFYGKPTVFADVNFSIELNEETTTFAHLDDSVIRRFREYAISTIEIDLDEEGASLDEVVNLFIDINQKGVKVSRFDIVKALVKDRLFKQVFKLIARKKDKKRSTYYKPLNNSFVHVLSKLSIIRKIPDENSQVDRMWERLAEIAIFAKDGRHRAPAEILRSLMDTDNKHKSVNKLLTTAQLTKLRLSFGFLADAYRHDPQLAETTLATDQPQFYTLITTLLSTDVLDRYATSHGELEKRLFAVAQIIEQKAPPPDSLKRAIANYRAASTKQTTHPGQRDIRQKMLVRAIDEVQV